MTEINSQKRMAFALNIILKTRLSLCVLPHISLQKHALRIMKLHLLQQHYTGYACRHSSYCSKRPSFGFDASKKIIIKNMLN